MADRIQLRRDTAANWTSADPTLAQGEAGYETDTNLFKIGDGSTAWTSLDYVNVEGPQGPQGPQGDTGATGADGADGADGAGVAAGGTAGQSLVKVDGTDYNTTWANRLDPATVSIATASGTSGLSGGGTLEATRNLVIDVNGTTSKATPVAADKVIIGDAAASWVRKSATLSSLAGAIPRTGIYRTIYIDAAAMVPSTTSGAEAASSETSTYKLMNDHLLFDPDAIEYAQFKLSMPDEWDRSTVKMKFFWSSGATNTGAVVWGVSAVARSNAEGIDDLDFGTAQTVADSTEGTGKLNVTAATGALTIAGSPALGDLIYFKLYRKANDVSDLMATNAALFGISIQYKESTTEPSAW